MTFKHLVLVLATGGLLGCGDSQVGTSTQTENHLGMRILRIDSIVPAADRPDSGTTVATLRFDRFNFDFTQADSAGRSLACERIDGAPIPFSIVYWDRIARLGRLHVRLDASLMAAGSRFVLRWMQPEANRSDANAVWHAIPDSHRLTIGSVLVADFEDGNDTTRLPTRPRWRAIASDSSPSPRLQFPEASGGRTGLALSFDYQITDSTLVVLKTPLVAGGSARTIRGLDSIVFYARGTGGSALFTAFEHHDKMKAWKLDTLGASWKRIRIRPSDFIPASNPTGGNRGWEAIRDSATHLSFLLTEATGKSFWIDDIRLYGLAPEDLR